MHIANRHCLALAAGLIATAVAAEETNPFIGNWSGVGPNAQHNEFNVVAFAARGQITALSCAERPNGTGFWFDIEPGAIDSSIKRRGRVLAFARPENRMRCRLSLIGTTRRPATRNGTTTWCTTIASEAHGRARVTSPSAHEDEAPAAYPEATKIPDRVVNTSRRCTVHACAENVTSATPTTPAARTVPRTARTTNPGSAARNESHAAKATHTTCLFVP